MDLLAKEILHLSGGDEALAATARTLLRTRLSSPELKLCGKDACRAIAVCAAHLVSAKSSTNYIRMEYTALISINWQPDYIF